MRRWHRIGGLQLLAAGLLALAVSTAMAVGWTPRGPDSDVRARLICGSVRFLKNQLMDGVHLGHRYLRGAVEASLNCTRQTTQCRRDPDAGGA